MAGFAEFFELEPILNRVCSRAYAKLAVENLIRAEADYEFDLVGLTPGVDLRFAVMYVRSENKLGFRISISHTSNTPASLVT